MEVMNLWEDVNGKCEEIPKITAYIPNDKKQIFLLLFCQVEDMWEEQKMKEVDMRIF